VSDDLRYPIGEFQFPERVGDSERESSIQAIADTPERLYEAVSGLEESQLDTPYRPGGWTIRQVVHHLPDSHLNSYVRFKLAVTENEPTVKTYDEAVWAELDDARNGDVADSLKLLESLHGRWVRFLRSLGPNELARTFQHPELGTVSVAENIALYAWHGRHHVAHINAARQREGWT
jgi:uncharacterized damage-inducible protein DinB